MTIIRRAAAGEASAGDLGGFATLALAVAAIEDAGSPAGLTVAHVIGTSDERGATLRGFGRQVQSCDIDWTAVSLTSVPISAEGTLAAPTTIDSDGLSMPGATAYGLSIDDLPVWANRYNIEAFFKLDSIANATDGDFLCAGLISPTGDWGKGTTNGIYYNSGVGGWRVSQAYYAAPQTPVIAQSASEHAPETLTRVTLDVVRVDPSGASGEGNFLGGSLPSGGVPVAGCDAGTVQGAGWVAVLVGVGDARLWVAVDQAHASDACHLQRLVITCLH